MIYKNFKAILFALEITDNKGLDPKIIPNPGAFRLPKRKVIKGYIISSDKSIADTISRY